MSLVAAACVFSGVLGDYNTQVNAIAQQSGFDPAVAAIAFSLVSGSLVVGKVALGWLRDHFGARASMAASCAIGIAAFALGAFALNSQSMPLLYASSALAGICTCLGTIGPALLVAEAFGAAAYARALALATAFCNVGMAVGAPLYSLAFDITGSYVPIMVVCAVLPIATFATAVAGIGRGQREQVAET